MDSVYFWSHESLGFFFLSPEAIGFNIRFYYKFVPEGVQRIWYGEVIQVFFFLSLPLPSLDVLSTKGRLTKPSSPCEKTPVRFSFSLCVCVCVSTNYIFPQLVIEAFSSLGVGGWDLLVVSVGLAARGKKI